MFIKNENGDVAKTWKYASWSSVPTPSQMGVCNFIVNGVPYSCDGFQFLALKIIITPEMFGAVSGTDATAAIQQAFNAASAGGKLVFKPNSTYTISSKISATLTGNIVIEGNNTTFNSVVSETDNAVIYIDGANSFGAAIDGINIVGSSIATGNVVGIYIYQNIKPRVINCYVSGVSSYGLFFGLCKHLEALFNYIKSNCFAGIGMQSCIYGHIAENLAESNGILGSANGYGITLVTKVSSGDLSNAYISVRNNICINPIRKGIDVHDGVDIVIDGNKVINTTGMQDTSSAGIYAVNESGTKNVVNIKVSNNFIDLTGAGATVSGIEVGNNSSLATDPKTINVTNNTIENSPHAGIFCYISTTTAISNLLITGNTINGSSASGDSAIFISNVSQPAKKLTISGNNIDYDTTGSVIRAENHAINSEVLGNIIKVPSLNASSAITLSSNAAHYHVIDDNNNIVGSFTSTISAGKQRGLNNLLNGVKIESIGFGSQFGLSSYCAEKTFECATGGAAVNLSLLTANTPTSQSNIFVHLRICEDSYDNGAKTLYDCYIYGRYIAGAFSTGGAATIDVKKAFVAGGIAPALAWINISGTSGTLQLTMNTTYSRSIIKCTAMTYSGSFNFL